MPKTLEAPLVPDESLAPGAEAQPPSWHMDARPGVIEGAYELHQDIISRLDVWDANGNDDLSQAPADAAEFHYAPGDYNTTVLEWDYDLEQDVEIDVPLGEFLRTRAPSSRYATPKGDILKSIASNVDVLGTEGWWLKASGLEHGLKQDIFHRDMPTEQLIVGQEGKGVRIFNFKEPMNAERIADCKRLIDTLTQYFEDRTYDFISDVVIADFDEDVRDPNVWGFVDPSMPKVIFIDGKLLNDANQALSGGLQYAGASKFLYVLLHEAGHTIHGESDEDLDQVAEFARKIGWDMEAMERDVPQWRMGANDNLDEYMPPLMYERLAVRMPDGTTRHMSVEEFDEAYYDEDGNQKGEIPSYTYLGSPSDYGRENPMESSADTTAHTMLGKLVVEMMPETRDAWLEHMQQRVLKPGEKPEDRLLATPLNRAPIVVDRRTGHDILYPHVKLPERINIRAIPNGEER